MTFQCDLKVVQLLTDLRAELRLVANARPGGQLDPHLPVLHPPHSGTIRRHLLLSRANIVNLYFLSDTSTSHVSGNFDAHAVYAGDDAVSSHGRWSQVATSGVRNALSALISYYGLDNTYNPAAPASSISRQPAGKPPAQLNLTQNIFLPSTSSQQSAFSS